MARGNTAVDLRILRQAYFDYALDNGIKDDAELLHFIEVFFEYALPNRSVCPHHTSPASFVTDQFFERITSCFGFANRTGGKTISVAILNVLDMLFKPGVEICSAGAVKEQATRGYDYVIEMLTKVGDLLQGPKLNVGRISKDEIILTNDSKARLITMSYTGLNSPHPQKFRCDEVELIHYDLVQEGFSMTQSKAGITAQDTLTSTRKVASGTVQKMLDEAEKRGMIIKSWCIWETLETCTRQCKGDPTYGDCPAYDRINLEGVREDLCAGKARELPPGGWYKIEDFVKKTQNLDRDTFEAQWLCLRPNVLQVVYGACFRDEAPWVVQPDEQTRILERYRAHPQSWARIYGQDFGSNWDVVELIQDPVDECWYVVWEYFWSAERDRSVARHADHMKTQDALGFDRSNFFGYADPAGRQVITDLEEYEIFYVPANNDVYAGINHVKWLFEQRKLRIFSTATNLRKELSQTYIHPQKRDGTIDRDRVQPRGNHGADALRYALFSYHTVGTATYGTARLRGI